MTIAPITSSLKRIRYAVFAFYFMQGLCFSSWASRIPDIKNSLGMDDAAWGTILLMIPVGQICGMSLSGLLVSRIGSKRILPIANIGYAATLLLVGLASSEYALIMSLIVFGFFGNFCNISVNTQAVNVERMYDKPIMASFHGGWSAAGLTGASIGLLMSSLEVNPFMHFCVVAALVVTNLIVNLKYLQEDVKVQKSPEERAARKKNKPEKFLFLLGIVAFCGMAAEGAMSDWSGLYLQDIVGVPAHLAPLGLTAYMITMATGRFFADKASSRFGQKRVVQAGGLLISAGLLLAVALPHVVTTLIAFMIIGFGTCSIVPTVYSVAGKKTKISTGMALTIVSSISFTGFLMGPPLIGYISHLTNLRYSYAFIALFGICIILLSSQIKVFKKD
ncbi:MFS transporter [Dysgonomonas sp. 25]|uniref:MFS transporter n=1 Tax=Dysgonomonas sp. 25 TaxID=2302933 RepID=UPI0013CFAE30|nr:MFS transporter [Dysgonomonas sp. 25]NDV69188.1 MFS transporter [Dysgonomonas sp. 25]